MDNGVIARISSNAVKIDPAEYNPNWENVPLCNGYMEFDWYVTYARDHNKAPIDFLKYNKWIIAAVTRQLKELDV